MSSRDEIKEVVRQSRWLPESINGQARELDWLANMGDWMISKKRFWGLALPIWVDEVTGEFEVIGSREELKQRAVEGWPTFEGHSPHRPWIDQVKVRNPKTGNLMVAHPRRGQPVAGRGHRAVLDHEVQHGSLILGKVVPGRLRDGGVPRPVPQLVLRHAGDEHHDGASVAVQDAVGPRPGARRARRGDAQVEGQLHPVRRGRRQDGRRPDALDVLPGEPGRQHQLRLPPGRPSCAASSQSSCGTATPSSATTPGRKTAASTCRRRPCRCRSGPISTAGSCRICKS